MQEEHQKIVQQFEENKKAIEKSKTKPLIIQILVILIVCGMKFIQETASIRLNAIAVGAVFFLLAIHFWGFFPRRTLYEEQTNIILRGLALEERNPFHKVSFFKD